MTSIFASDAFAGQVVLITGATSGIGAGTARAFAANGASVMLNGRHADRGLAVRDAIRSSGGTAELSVGDVANSSYCDSLVDQTVQRYGRVDVLFNNAGIVVNSRIEDMDDTTWGHLIDTNLMCPL